jgi:hypothetical protein
MSKLPCPELVVRSKQRLILHLAASFALVILLSALAFSWLPWRPEAMSACSTSCVTPFGTRLGATTGGVVAFSNCSPGCVVLQSHRIGGSFMGLKWQCVEFARRWLVERRGLDFASVATAADIWDEVQVYRDLEDGREWLVTSHPNGSPLPPKPGDLFVYGRGYRGTGHVAVVVEVAKDRGWLAIAEQNFDNRPWPGTYARRLPLVRHTGVSGVGWWVLDAYLIGWKRAVDPGLAE